MQILQFLYKLSMNLSTKLASKSVHSDSLSFDSVNNRPILSNNCNFFSSRLARLREQTWRFSLYTNVAHSEAVNKTNSGTIQTTGHVRVSAYLRVITELSD